LRTSNTKSNATNHQNIHRKDKIHLIQPEKLPNSKQTENHHMNKKRYISFSYRIEQVRQHRIVGLIFDSRMTWNEHILYAKAKAEKDEPNQCQSHTTRGADQANLIKIHRYGILRYGEEAYGSASQVKLKKLDTSFDASVSNQRERMNMHTNLQHLNPYLYGRRNRLETYKKTQEGSKKHLNTSDHNG
jgi:hypothetical protein